MVSPDLIPPRAAELAGAAHAEEQRAKLFLEIRNQCGRLNRMVSDASLLHCEVDLTVRNDGAGAPTVWPCRRQKTDIR